MVQNNIEIRNGIAIDKIKVKRIITKIIIDENVNQRTKVNSDSDMVSKHMETIKEELNAY